MKLQKILLIPVLALLLFLSAGDDALGQCNITASSNHYEICLGDCVVLSSQGECPNNLMYNDFNNGTIGQGWSANCSPMFTNPCNPSANGTIYAWIGDASSFPRDLETVSYTVNDSCQICFDIKFATQGDLVPCEGPDEQDEGVELQWSTNNGATWTSIAYFHPNGNIYPQNVWIGQGGGPNTPGSGDQTTFTSWANYCFDVPAPAASTSTKFRWHQEQVTSNSNDHWGVDNVVISCPSPSEVVTWYKDSIAPGTLFDSTFNPPTQCPNTSTTYYVQIEDTSAVGQAAGYDSVDITVYQPPVLDISGLDSVYCESDAPAQLVGSPAGGTFSGPGVSNGEFDPSAAGAGGPYTITYTWDQMNSANNSILCTYDTTAKVWVDAQPVANAGTDDQICGQNYTLNASPSVGNGQWTVSPASGLNIASPTDPNSNVTATSFGSYTLTWTETNGLCSDQSSINLDFYPVPTSDFSLGNISCYGDDASVNYNGNMTNSANYNWNWDGGNASPGNGQGPHAVNWSAPGTHSVSLTVSENGCTSNTTTHTVNNPTEITTTVSGSNYVCANACDATATASPSGGTGSYTYLWDDPGSQTTQTASGLCGGDYQVIVSDVNGCTATDSLNIPVYPTLSVENFTDNLCTPDNLHYIVSFDVLDNNGDSATFIVNGTQYFGSFSQVYPSNTPYDLHVTDPYNCTDIHLQGSYSCPCITYAGTMTTTQTQNLCDDECTSPNMHNGNQNLDGNDVMDFILHDGQNPPTIFARSSNTEFCFNSIPGLNTETTYYISAVAGNDDGTGKPDPNDVCYNMAIPTPVVWHNYPVANIYTNDTAMCDNNVILKANETQPYETGTWNLGSINCSPTSGYDIHDSVIKILCNTGNYNITWTVNNHGCTNSDNVNVEFNNVVTPFAGNDTTVCGMIDTLNAELPSGSSGSWSGNGVTFENSTDPNSTVTASAPGTYTLTWTVDNGACVGSDEVLITFLEQPQPSIAKPVDTTCGTLYDLNVNNVTSSGVWNAFLNGNPASSVQFNNPNSPNTQVSVPSYSSLNETYTFVWTETNQQSSTSCVAEVQAEITFSKQPSASVGNENQPEICGSQYTFNADTSGSGWANGIWIADGTTVNWDDQNIPDATVNIPQGAFGDSAYVTIPFIWTMNNYGCSDMDTAFVTFYQQPDANAGLDDSVCGLQYQLGAVYNLPEYSNSYTTSGSWAPLSGNPAGSNFNNQNNDTTLVNVDIPGVYQYQWTENNTKFPSCTDSDTVEIKFIDGPVIDAGDAFNVCGQQATLQAVGDQYNGKWQNVPGVNFSDVNNDTTTVTYSSTGSVIFTWQESNSNCTATDTVTVTFWKKPNAELSMNPADTMNCGRIFTDLRAQNPGSGLNGNWIADPKNGVDFYQQNFSDTMEVSYYQYYDIRWVESNHPANEPPTFCADTTEPWTIHFVEIPDADAGPDTIFCGKEGIMQAELDIPNTATGQWSSLSPANITFDSINDPNTMIYSNVLTNPNPDYNSFDITWTEYNMGCTNSDTARVGFARVPIADMSTIPPKCFGEPASIKAKEDSLAAGAYDWSLYGGIVDSIWEPNDQDGEYRRLVYWEDGDTAHIIGLTVENHWGCRSSINIDTIFEPPVAQYRTIKYPDTCMLGKGKVIFRTDSTDPAFEWLDTTGTGITDTDDTVQTDIPGGKYPVVHEYGTPNPVYSTFYIETFGTDVCRDTFNVVVDTIGMIQAEFAVASDINLDELVAPNAGVWFNNDSDSDELNTSSAWYFDDDNTETNNEEQVQHIYKKPGKCYEPYLVVYSRDIPECRDTAYLDECIVVDAESNLEVPNIFSPNGDNQNDFFQVKAKTLKKFEGKIINRWGHEIYTWNNYESEKAGWNGKLEGGTDASPGVYYYIIKAEGFDGVTYEKTGALHLVKGN